MFLAIIFHCVISDKRDLNFYSCGSMLLKDQGRDDIYGKKYNLERIYVLLILYNYLYRNKNNFISLRIRIIFYTYIRLIPVKIAKTGKVY